MSRTSDILNLPSQNPATIRQDRQADYTLWVERMWLGFKIFGGFFLGSILIFSFFTPSFKELEDPSFNIASEILAADGKTPLGRFFIENRSPITYEQLSPKTVKTLVASEDLRFYEHSGVDAEALGRVALKTVFQRSQGGGSTISMQLAKLLYSDRNLKGFFLWKAMKMYYYKLSEMITAVKLERQYTKEEIIAMYLNKYDFINGAVGIKAAAEIYFNKQPKDLNWEESALLVGMLQNSALYNPMRRAEKSKAKRNQVIDKMERNGVVDAKTAIELKKKPMDMSKFRLKNHTDGLATYFRMELAKDLQDIIKKNDLRKPDGSRYDIYRDGLKIYTTIDPEMQRLAEESMWEHMKTLQAKYFRVWKGKDPWEYKDRETTDQEIMARRVRLVQQMRETERYQRLRSQYLDEILETVENDLDNVKIMDSDMDIMLKAEAKTSVLNEMIRTRSLTTDKVELYTKIMNSDDWKDLKGQWGKFQTAIKSDFNKKTKMKVFAYNEKREKDTLMSPLDSMKYHRMMLQLGSVAVDPRDGAIRSWVGGVNYKYFQYDHVRSNRQVGSTFKPFVYATAISQLGISPCYTVTDVAQTIGVGEGSFNLARSWTPSNAGGYSGSTFTLWEALKESKNTASVYLMKQIGTTEPVRALVHTMGIDSASKYPNGQYRVPKQPSICLGATDLTVLEMAGAYTTFADNGVVQKPYSVVKVVDKKGHIIYQSLPESRPALPENANYVMLQMLKYVTKGAPGIGTLKSEVGGKTGTTNSYVDGWFMGITPTLVVGTWVGGEDNWIRFLTIADGQGGAMARPFCAKFLQKVEASNKVIYYDATAKFKVPTGDLGITIDCSQYTGYGGGGGVISTNPNTGSEFNTDRFSDEEEAPATEAPAPKPAPTNPKPSSGTNPTTPKPSTGTTPTTTKPTPTKPSTNTTPTVPKPKPKPTNPNDDGFGG